MSSSDSSRNETRVAIISANQETLDDLQRYLLGFGVQASCGRHFGLADKLAPTVVALVVFPDDFLRRTVIAALTTVVASQHQVLSVLITAEPLRYERGLPDMGHFL